MDIAERKVPAIIAALLFAAAFFSAAITCPGFGITWDEPTYVAQSRRITEWFGMLASEPGRALSDKEIILHWPVWKGGQPAVEGNTSVQDRLNPPLAIAMGSLSGFIFEGPLSTFTSHRLVGALSFAFIAALLFVWISGPCGVVPGLVASLSFSLMPRMFGHGHIFATDMPAAALILFAAFALSRTGSKRWMIAGGAILGFAAATKFTALILPAPVFVWAAIRRDKRAMAYTVIAGLIAVPVMIAVNPGLWHDTIARIGLFLDLSTQRSRFIAIPAYYFGKVYWFGLPWHHPWVMVFGTIPAVSALLALAGAARVFIRREANPAASLSLAIFVAFMLAFMAPNAPGHDGARLFMPVFPFVAALAGYGFAWIYGSLKNRNLRAAAVAAALIPGAIGIICWHPYELSYYGLLLGGARGAHRLGMETTYWMDALSPRSEAQIRQATEGSVRSFSPFYEPLEWRAETGKLGDGAYVTADDPEWTLRIARQGMLDDFERLALEYGNPTWELDKDGLRLAALFKTAKMYDGIDARLDTLDQNKPCTWYKKGLLAEVRGNFDEALKDYDKALGMKAGFERAVLHRGRVLRALGRYAEAADIFNKLIKENPTAEYRMELARTYAAQGLTQQALDQYKKVLNTHINYPGALEEYMKLMNSVQ